MDKKVFTGGLRMTFFNATWPIFNATSPFARMTVDDDGILIRVFGVKLFQTAWASLTHAERVVGGFMATPGVRLVRADGRRVVFWTYRPQPVFDALREHGVTPLESRTPPRVWGRP